MFAGIQKYRNRIWWEWLLYSCMGCFSYFLLVHYTDIPVRHQDRLLSFQAFFAVVIAFNGIGLIVHYINEKLMMYYQHFLRNHRLLSVALLLAAIILFISNYLLLSFTKILIDLPHPFYVQNNGLYVILGIWFVELIIVGQFMLNRFYSDLVRLYKCEKELQESAAQVRYMALQSQLNPHFLFNSLNTLISEIEYSPKSAVEFTRNLADTYRYILYCQDKHTVLLSEELDFIDTYVSLQKVRLGNCLTVDNQIDKAYWEIPMPPLTLQLLVENVIKHNVISKTRPMSIEFSIEVSGDDVWICVSNDRQPKYDVISSGKGLKNLAQRYQMLCHKDIRIEKTDNKFVVKVPLLYE